MASHKFPDLLLCALIVSALAGCAYPISKDLREAASMDLTLSMVVQNPKPYLGSIVIWGGIMFEVMNRPKGTEVTIIQIPLDSGGYPNTRITQGRFIAKTDKSLDPEIYKKGKKITLAGEITGIKEKELGPMKIPYPVVEILELHLWENKKGKTFPLTKGWEWEFYDPHLSPFEDNLDDLSGPE